MTISRRSTLTGLAAMGAAMGTASTAKASGTVPSQRNRPDLRSVGKFNPPMIPPRPVEFEGLLLNQERAESVLEQEKVDLLICSKEANYYYLTGHSPGSHMLGYDAGIDFATLSAHGDGRPTMITSQVGLYFQGTAQSQLDLMNVEIVGFPADFAQFASLTDPVDIANAPGAPFVTRRHDKALESESERYRHALIERESGEIRGSIEAALLKQVLDTPLPNKTIAIDDLRIKGLLQRSGMDVRFVDGERIVRKIRIQKTPLEIGLMRYAASANATAARAAALSVRNGASFDDLRREFWKECADLDMTGHYMMVDTLMSRISSGEIEEGRSFLIDCVSTFRGYHGDYGRTVCVGEPNRKMAGVIDALSLTWNRLLEELKPGMRFSQVIERGKALYADTNIDVAFNVSPHTIGLNHSDDENVAGFGSYAKADIELEENMILSVDMPLLDSGLGGTAHLEDLALITKDGPVLINDSSDRFIVV